MARAQYDAIVEWGIPDPSRLARLAGITQPTLVANGDNDLMIPTVNSQLLVDHLPNARLRIFTDAAHGFLFQYPRQFAALVEEFLTGPEYWPGLAHPDPGPDDVRLSTGIVRAPVGHSPPKPVLTQRVSLHATRVTQRTRLRGRASPPQPNLADSDPPALRWVA